MCEEWWAVVVGGSVFRGSLDKDDACGWLSLERPVMAMMIWDSGLEWGAVLGVVLDLGLALPWEAEVELEDDVDKDTCHHWAMDVDHCNNW